MNDPYSRQVAVFKAFCDENRWKILDLLTSGEKCACVLLNKLEISQSTLSHHMKILCDSGIVTGRKEGKWTHYSLSPQGVQAAVDLLQPLASPLHGSVPCTCTPSLQRGDDSMEQKTQLYVLTGFLGSGKTTILLKLLETLKDKKIGIIQNEFGKLSIDGDILRNDDIKMIELNRGSIFCSCLRLSFVEALAEMASYHFDYLFVESSGIGDPSNVLEIIEATKQITGDCFDYRGSLCLVDAVNFLDQLDDLESVHRQLKHCHMAVLTKIDLVDAQRLTELKEKIRQINPICRIETSANASLDLSFLNEDLLRYQWAESE
ncbi:MAG: metalloregulator ArsR/SmtB family transcription factor, partial [Negativibacillus sp.]|nr:metalloregulator ArsR/SmtB family transcription factor [Negativibacillus sp.]